MNKPRSDSKHAGNQANLFMCLSVKKASLQMTGIDYPVCASMNHCCVPFPPVEPYKRFPKIHAYKYYVMLRALITARRAKRLQCCRRWCVLWVASRCSVCVCTWGGYVSFHICHQPTRASVSLFAPLRVTTTMQVSCRATNASLADCSSAPSCLALGRQSLHACPRQR